MIRLVFIVISYLLVHSALSSQIIIQEVYGNNTFELKNTGTITLDLSNYWMSTSIDQVQIDAVELTSLTVLCGSLILTGGEEVVLQAVNFYNTNDGDLSLCGAAFFGICITGFEVAYVEWGSTGHALSTQAVSLGIWDGNAVVGFGNTESIEVIADQTTAAGWAVNPSPNVCGVSMCDDVLVVNDVPIPSGTYSANQTLSSTGTVASGGDVTFTAIDYVLLDVNFAVEQNGMFEALIQACP